MPNERLREALLRSGLTPQSVAAEIKVDAKTVERWITKGRMPYPKHRFAIAALVNEPESFLWPEAAPRRQFADVEAVFPTRAEFVEAMPPREIFKNATSIDMAGLSLNLLCQQYSDREIEKLLKSRCLFRCLFLDPAGNYIREREKEEGHNPGLLSNLTEINISSMTRLRARVGADASEFMLIRTYDQPIRFNITVVNKTECIAQPYLPTARGVESPTFVSRRTDQPGIFDTFSQVFESLWANGNEVS
ncbi:DUF5919 domain-containing protein [Nocardia nova]|uniref:DUF5919 domain-containing protein n=1 Tax=Nocardia nova TaxID=37330 RepID=UPI000CEA3C87